MYLTVSSLGQNTASIKDLGGVTKLDGTYAWLMWPFAPLTGAKGMSE